MPTEIERRWLVRTTQASPGATLLTLPTVPDAVRHIEQGYLERSGPLQSLRIRIIDNRKAVVTGKTGSGMERDEEEYAIPLDAAKLLMRFCDHRLMKTRHVLGPWEIDEFHGPLAGIIMAELESPDRAVVLAAVPPVWLGDTVEVTESLTNLHLARLATDREGTGYAPLRLVDVQTFGCVRRIVVTGGPGSGKTQLLRELRQTMPDAHFVPEVASIVISQLGIKPSGDAVRMRRFQNAIWRTQKIFERTSVEFAASEGKRMVIMDRGTVDNAAYLPGTIRTMEHLFNTTLVAEYSNYDAVLWLEPAPRDVYERIKSNNTARSESYEDAVQLGQGVADVWRSHRNFTVIPNGTSWEEKVASARTAIAKLKL